MLNFQGIILETNCGVHSHTLVSITIKEQGEWKPVNGFQHSTKAYTWPELKRDSYETSEMEKAIDVSMVVVFNIFNFLTSYTKTLVLWNAYSEVLNLF